MIVERKKPKPIKSWYLKREIDKFGRNVHLFKEVRNNKRLFNFIISKDEEELDNISNPENIIATINTDNEENTKFLVSQLGKSFKSVYQINRPMEDYDLFDALEKNIESINCNFWKSKKSTKYISPEEKVKQAQEEVKRKANYSNSFDKRTKEMYAIKPIIMIEALEKAGIIRINAIEPNSDESKYKFSFVDKSKYGNINFNISVAKHSGLSGNKSNIFKDFYNEHKKGLGNSGIGLISHLGEYGLFPESNGSESNETKIERSKKFIENNIFNLVDKNNLVFNEESASRIFLDKSVSFQPIKTDNDSEMQKIKDFLTYRHIPEKVVDMCIKEDLLFTGSSYVSRILKEKKDNSEEFKPNYQYANFPFFRLQKQYGGFSGAEVFLINRSNDKNKPFIYDKQNTGAVDGRFFMFGEKKNPELAILHEAILDSFSSYVLLDEANVNADRVKYISTQGASHMKKFFSKNMGFWTKTSSKLNEEDKENRTTAVYFNQNTRDLSLEIQEDYKDKLKEKEMVYYDYGDTTPTMEKQIKEISTYFGKGIKTIKTSDRNKIDFYAENKDNSILIDNQNFKDLLDHLKLKYEYNKDTKKTDLKTFYIRENNVKLDNYKKETIKKRIVSFFGTNNVAFALDNDHAGLPYLILFSEMKRHFDINVSYMVPDDLKYENFEGMTLKKMLEDFTSLCDKENYEDAYSLVHKYIKQKPYCDNNDTLVNYNNLKLSNPKEADKILKNKIEQLGIINNPNLFPKKNKKPSNRP